jgi:hypothetical protein
VTTALSNGVGAVFPAAMVREAAVVGSVSPTTTPDLDDETPGDPRPGGVAAHARD